MSQPHIQRSRIVGIPAISGKIPSVSDTQSICQPHVQLLAARRDLEQKIQSVPGYSVDVPPAHSIVRRSQRSSAKCRVSQILSQSSSSTFRCSQIAEISSQFRRVFPTNSPCATRIFSRSRIAVISSKIHSVSDTQLSMCQQRIHSFASRRDLTRSTDCVRHTVKGSLANCDDEAHSSARRGTSSRPYSECFRYSVDVSTARSIARSSQILSQCVKRTFSRSQTTEVFEQNSECTRHSVDVPAAYSIARRSQGSRAKFRVFQTHSRCANNMFKRSRMILCRPTSVIRCHCRDKQDTRR